MKKIDIKLFEQAQITSNIASIPGLVAQGLGISVMNVISAYDMSDQSTIKIIPLIPTNDLHFYVIYHLDWAENHNIDHLLKALESTITIRKRQMQSHLGSLLNYIP